jgi:signal transduction histidine kinase
MPEISSNWSLQTRVGLISTLSMVTGLVIGGVGMYQAAAVEMDDITEKHVELLAQEILESVKENRSGKLGTIAQSDSPLQWSNSKDGPSKYQVWLNNGSQLHRSFNTPGSEPITPLDFSGHTKIKIQGEDFTVYATATPDRKIVVQVAQRSPNRMLQIASLTGKYLALIFLPMGIVLLALRSLLKRTFRSLDHISTKLQDRVPGDFTIPIIENPPHEVLPIARSLDSLFRRVSHAMSVEQRFTSVAAHELRTPLAGIRAQAQIASRARDQEELQDALNSVLLGVDKAKLVIEQLIDLAKVESTSGDIEWSNLPIKLSNIYAQVMDELAPVAHARRVKLSTDFGVDHITGLDFAIYMLMRNLIANAILYSPQGGDVEVRTERQGKEAILTIDDTGPGIPLHEREGAFQKFNRLGKNGPDGVGLGLSIVAQVAKLHQAKVDLLSSPLGGLRAQVVFRQLV